MTDPRRDEGFTMVELLVTMFIVGVLAAIAIPAFLSTRQKAYVSAMRADLHSVVLAEASWVIDHPAPTTDPSDLVDEGYRQTNGVTLPHVKVTATAYVACVTHAATGDWLVYDSTTGALTTSAADCA